MRMRKPIAMPMIPPAGNFLPSSTGCGVDDIVGKFDDIVLVGVVVDERDFGIVVETVDELWRTLEEFSTDVLGYI